VQFWLPNFKSGDGNKLGKRSPFFIRVHNKTLSLRRDLRQQQSYLVDFGLKLGVGVARLPRVRRVFFCCIVGVRVLTADIVAEATGVGVVVCNATGVGVVVGDAADVGGITAGVSVAAADTCSEVGLFAIPNTIATTTETVPTPIAQRARRCVWRCFASLCLRSISLRSSASRSDAVIISFGGSVGSDWISKK
jgi:hypothetical protein